MQRYRAMALSAVALGVLLSGGCGPSTTNEENVTSTPGQAGGPGPVKDYGEYIKRQQAKEAQAKAEAKEAKAASKAAPKGP